MKKFDSDFDDEETPGTDISFNKENFPTAVYTVYNIHGEPIGHRMYSYQPSYEVDDVNLHNDDVSHYDDSEDVLAHATILKGGMFTDTDDNGIDRLKHEYFERYVDKRRKRFLNKNIDDVKLADSELQSEETATESFNVTPKVRTKRGINIGEFEHFSDAMSQEDIEFNAINIDLLKVIPLHNKTNDDAEIAVVPLQYNKTNTTEVGNLLEKRDKRTSRKTDRLNQTTASVPKT